MLNFIEKSKSEIKNRLKEIIEEYNYSNVLKQSMQYTALNFGKFFRPMLVLTIMNDLDVNEEASIDVACAIEMLHIYGIIHDDLPALDDARYRRKKIANHLVYGEAQAILAGDALQAGAFNVLSNTKIDCKKLVEMIKLLTNIIGPNGYVGGQSLDIISENEEKEYLENEIIEKIHFGKTAALIKGSILCGGILGNADEATNEKLNDLAYEIGMAFQIRDDIIDVISTLDESGKDSKSDIKKDKTTYPKMYGLEKSKQLLEEHKNKSLELTEKLFGENSKTYNFIKESFK